MVGKVAVNFCEKLQKLSTAADSPVRGRGLGQLRTTRSPGLVRVTKHFSGVALREGRSSKAQESRVLVHGFLTWGHRGPDHQEQHLLGMLIATTFPS